MYCITDGKPLLHSVIVPGPNKSICVIHKSSMEPHQPDILDTRSGGSVFVARIAQQKFEFGFMSR